VQEAGNAPLLPAAGDVDSPLAAAPDLVGDLLRPDHPQDRDEPGPDRPAVAVGQVPHPEPAQVLVGLEEPGDEDAGADQDHQAVEAGPARVVVVAAEHVAVTRDLRAQVERRPELGHVEDCQHAEADVNAPGQATQIPRLIGGIDDPMGPVTERFVRLHLRPIGADPPLH